MMPKEVREGGREGWRGGREKVEGMGRTHRQGRIGHACISRGPAQPTTGLLKAHSHRRNHAQTQEGVDKASYGIRKAQESRRCARLGQKLEGGLRRGRG